METIASLYRHPGDVGCWLVPLISAVFWRATYWLSGPLCRRFFATYRSLSAEDRVDWDSRTVSNLHAVYATVAGAYCLHTRATWADLHLDGFVPLDTFLMAVCLGYFIHDLLLCLMNPVIRAATTLVHHFLGMIVFPFAFWMSVGEPMLLVFLITEATTPFVNQRYFFEKAHMTGSLWHVFNGLAMWAGFFGVRVIYATWAVVLLVLHGWPTFRGFHFFTRLGLTLMFSTITVLNAYWFARITRGLIRAVQKILRLAATTQPSQEQQPLSPKGADGASSSVLPGSSEPTTAAKAKQA